MEFITFNGRSYLLELLLSPWPCVFFRLLALFVAEACDYIRIYLSETIENVRKYNVRS